jgi:peptidoglycan/LPS O-acetylase OafA/YrhL
LLGGDVSYALYLSHEFVFNGAILLRVSIISNPWALVMVLCGLSICVAIIIHMVFERPVVSRLNQLIVMSVKSPALSGPVRYTRVSTSEVQLGENG